MSSRYLELLGIPGFVGVGLLLFCTSLYFSAVAPAQAQLDSARSEARKLAAALRAPEPIVRATFVEADASLAGIKPASVPIEIIRRLNAAAETAAVTIDRSSYTISDKDGRKRIEVSLPTKGGYLPIRSYLREALTVGRSAQIDSLVLQRARTTDPVLDAHLKLSFELDAK